MSKMILKVTAVLTLLVAAGCGKDDKRPGSEVSPSAPEALPGEPPTRTDGVPATSGETPTDVTPVTPGETPTEVTPVTPVETPTEVTPVTPEPPVEPEPPPACDAAVREVPSEGWLHEDNESVVLRYLSNPPASGTHYPRWARYEAYDAAVPRGHWVHNLEHGAVVLLYRPDAPVEAIDALKALYASLPPDPVCGYPRVLLTPDPLLARPVAAVAADHVLETDCVTPSVWKAFLVDRLGKGAEDVCTHGSWPQ